jgi:hypothetical protein
VLNVRFSDYKSAMIVRKSFYRVNSFQSRNNSISVQTGQRICELKLGKQPLANRSTETVKSSKNQASKPLQIGAES